MAIKLRIGGKYKVRDQNWCKSNGFVIEDEIIGIDETYERHFKGRSGETYFLEGWIYGVYQKFESDLVEEIL